MYVHIIDNQSDDIQQSMQNTGNCCVKVNIGHIWGTCELPSILANAVGPAVIVGRAPLNYYNHSVAAEVSRRRLTKTNLHGLQSGPVLLLVSGLGR